MTLATIVYVVDPTDVRETFRYCQSLLAKWDAQDRPASGQQTLEIRDDPTSYVLGNRMNQGLPALLSVYYREDGPLRARAAEHDEDCEDDCDGASHVPAHAFEIVFDTAYSYGDHGLNAGSLHAVLLSDLGRWFGERGVRWMWRNEYTGEIHEGAERLSELVGTTEEAKGFVSSVLSQLIGGEKANG